MESPFNINVANVTGQTVLGTERASYGDNQFLQLLTEQLRNQTPFEPVDSESFNTQLASYSNMEEQRQLNTNMLKLLDFQGVLARSQGLSQGSNLLGKSVEYVSDNGATGSSSVSSVFINEAGEVRLSLADGVEIDLRQVLGISQAAAGASGSGSSTGSTSGSNTSSGSSSSSSGGSSGSSSSGGSSNSGSSSNSGASNGLTTTT